MRIIKKLIISCSLLFCLLLSSYQICYGMFALSSATSSSSAQSFAASDSEAGKQLDQEEIVKKFKQFFLQNMGVEPKNAVAITIQRNRTTEYATVIVDMRRNVIVDLYPAELLSSYKETAVGPFLVCYNADLSVDPIADFKEFVAEKPIIEVEHPFCCESSKLVAYKPRRLDKEKFFTDFMSGSGSYPDIIFQVIKQINNGPIQSTTYWQLIDNKIVPWTGEKPEQKLHAFKNYICHKCNFFYSIDIFSTSGGMGYNFHHMRLVPYTKLNVPLLTEFFKAAGV